MRTSYPEKRMCSGCSSSYRALPLRPADPKQFENHPYRATGGSEAHPLREPYGNPYGSLREFQQPISSPWGVFLIAAPGGKGRPFVPLAASKHPEVPLQHVLSLRLILVRLLTLHLCQCRFYCLSVARHVAADMLQKNRAVTGNIVDGQCLRSLGCCI